MVRHGGFGGAQCRDKWQRRISDLQFRIVDTDHHDDGDRRHACHKPVQVGSWEQIGRHVEIRFDVQLSGWTGSPTGQTVISGFPLASANVSNDFGICTVTNYVVSGLAASTAGIVGTVAPGASQAGLVAQGVAAASNGFTPLTPSQAGTTLVLVGNCQYRAF